MDTPDDQAKEPITESTSQPGTVVQGNATSGRDFIGRDQVTNRTFVGKLIVNPWAWVIGIAMIAIAVVLVGVISNAEKLGLVQTPTLLPSPTPLPTPMAFAPAKEGESLIIIADFDNRSEGTQPGRQPAQYIYDQLDKQVKDDELNVRVERLHQVLNERTARPVGETYSATLLLWGWYDSLSVKPVIERIRKADFAPRADTERLSISDPDKVEPAITTGLPNQVSYLILLTLGLEQYGRGNVTETLRYFDTIVETVALNEITPTNRSQVYYWRGTAYLHRGSFEGATGFYDRGDYEQAIMDFDEALKLNPDNALAYNNRAAAYLHRGDYAQAITDATQAIQLQPDYALAYSNRAAAYKARGDKEQAIADFKKALELSTDARRRAQATEALKELEAQP